MENPASIIAYRHALAVKTTQQTDGYFRTKWQTSELSGNVGTQATNGPDQLFHVGNERVVDVREAREAARPAITESLPAPQTNKGMETIRGISRYLQDRPASVTERCSLIREFVSAQNEDDLESLLVQNLPKIAKSISLVLDTALDSVARPIERAIILRAFVSALPTVLSYLPLPDGTKAAITGHVIDRLMTRFNIRCPITCLRMLHKNAARLRVVQLPVLIQVAHQVHHLTTSTHWRLQRAWTLVETNGVIVTAYYPSQEKPACADRNPGFRARKSVQFY